MKRVRSDEQLGYLGVEAGATRTTARLENRTGELILERVFGPGNLRLLNDPELLRLFRSIARIFPRPEAMGIGLAGMRTEHDRKRILMAAAKAWPATPC